MLGTLPRVLVGSGPQAVALDSATHTAYVANQNDNTLSVINTRICNARKTTGCGHTLATVAAGTGRWPWPWTRPPTLSTWRTCSATRSR